MPPAITNRRRVSKDIDDAYFTPKWATMALLHYEKFEGKILEPCCGNGAISKLLKQQGYRVHSQDLNNFGYGKIGRDFLKHKKLYANMITNPPFNIVNKLSLHALSLTKNKLCLFLRLAFLESITRYNTIYKYKALRPTTVYVFVERVTLYPFKDKSKKKNGGTTSYAWFVWDKSVNNKTIKIKFIEPGFKKKFGV